jgi:ankyrin repeat protein
VEDTQTPLSLIKLLIAKGANTNPTLLKSIQARAVLDGADGTLGAGTTPFLRAARAGDLEVMKLLLDNKANPKLMAQGGVNALMIAAGAGWRDGKTRATDSGSVEAIQFLAKLGMDVNYAAPSGETALHSAAGRGANSVVQALADLGAGINALDKQNRTPLDIANGVGGTLAGVRAPNEATVALLAKLGGKSAPANIAEADPKPAQ